MRKNKEDIRNSTEYKEVMSYKYNVTYSLSPYIRETLGLSTAEWIIHAVILNFSLYGEMGCYVGNISRLQAITGFTSATVSTTLKSLCERGIIRAIDGKYGKHKDYVVTHLFYPKNKDTADKNPRAKTAQHFEYERNYTKKELDDFCNNLDDIDLTKI